MTEPSRRALLRVMAALPLAGAVLPAMTTVSGCAGWPLRETVRLAVVESGQELQSFRPVLNAFTKDNNLFAIEVVPLGDEIGAVLEARASGAADVVLLPQPGLVREHKHLLETVDWAWDDAGRFAPEWQRLLRVDGKLFGVPFKVAHKSLVWYRRSVFRELGLNAPASWADWRQLNSRLIGAGIAPMALGAADGWVLTDLFENVLLGLSRSTYQQLAACEPQWQSCEVLQAFQLLGEMLAEKGVLAGGVSRALTTQYEDAVVEVFVRRNAAMVPGADFIRPVIEQFNPGDTDVAFFRFPPVTPPRGATTCHLPEPPSGARPLVAGGDVAVLPAPSTDGGRRLIEWLANPESMRVWLRYRKVLAADRDVAEDFPMDPGLVELSRQLREGFEFDLSDDIGRVGGGLGETLQYFLAQVGDRPGSVSEAAKAAGSRMADIARRYGRQC